MVETKGASAAAKAWEDAIPRVATKYKEGVMRQTDFAAKAIAGEDNYVAGVTAAAAEGSRAKGLQAMNPAKWQNNAASKGFDRIAGGMNAAKSEYNSQIGKVIGVLEGIQLSPRTTDPSANVERVREIAVGLAEAKKAGAFR